MEELNLKDMWDYYVSKVFIIIFSVLFCVVAVLFYSVFIEKPMYSSYTTIVLVGNSQTESQTGITQSDVTLNQKLVSTYQEIIKSRRILSQVIDNLKLDISSSTLAGNVSVTSEKDTELIRITVNNGDATLARDIANEIANVFNKEIVEIYNIKNVNVIDEAEVPASPSNMSIIKKMFLAAIVGFVLSCMVIFVFFYFDTTVKSLEELEEKLGLPVLGGITYNSHYEKEVK